MSIVKREQIRPAIKEMDTVKDIHSLINMCFTHPEENNKFVRECASEIYWRQKEQRGYDNDR